MNRFCDLLLLLLIFPIVFPLIFSISVCAVIFHGKNIFFKQERLGKNKKVFFIYKFRSMIVNAQNIGTGLCSYADDPRITKFGKFLRRTSLDELPQLINVFKGEMSFIGPRPPVLGELELENYLPEQVDLRFTVRPGLTGWAQIHGRDNLSWFEKASMDIYFVKLKGYKRVLAILYVLVFTPVYLFNFSATYEKRKT
jgi:undecaprenyl phosphate N,N'-diacetylbacillosamine 1-phosphate transferase